MSGSKRQKSEYPFWAPRFWHGMRFGDWLRLVRRNRFRIHPLRWGLAATVTGVTLFNSSMARWMRWRYDEAIQATQLAQDPIFIVGHWRSGTTYLHELMSCDPRFTTPTTFECFAANHFLVTAAWLPRIVWFLLPSRRPMDNVKTGWNSPQEDEFALCSLGADSPYLRMAFPNETNQWLESLDQRSFDAQAVKDWQSRLTYFLKSLTLRHRQRLILKSPTHTARIGRLAKMFPNARFLHIVRDPRSIYPSTINLWKVLDDAQALQRPKHDRLKAYVLTAFDRMYQAFEEQRAELSDDRVFDLRYEDLVEHPVEVLKRAYEHLALGDFEAIRPALVEMTQANRRYQTNRYELPDELADEVMDRWAGYAMKYGYA